MLLVLIERLGVIVVLLLLELFGLGGVSRVFLQLLSETSQVRIVRLVFANRGASFMVIGQLIICDLNANFMRRQHKGFELGCAHTRVTGVHLGARS